MNSQFFSTLWNNLWHQHDLVKRLLTFSFIHEDQAKQAEAKAKDSQNANHDQDGNNRSFSRMQWIGLFLGPALFIAIMLFFNPEGLPAEAKAVLAGTAWIATWWITEPIPIPATSLLPILIFPMTGALATKEVTASYGGDIIFLFLGGFIIALAMERWGLHKRIALAIISLIGTSTNRLILGFMVATGFLSMWISNTATALMMIPISTAIIYQLSESIKKETNGAVEEDENFSKAIMLGIAYAASIGGVATLIGTPPNAILAGVIQELFDIKITFVSWMMFGTPISVLILGLTWFYLIKKFPFRMKEIPGGKQLINEQKRELGKASFEEKAVLVVFILTATLWVFYPFVPESWGWIKLDDTMIAILAAVLLFIIPSVSKKGTGLIDWDTAKQLPWGTLLLFGGGLAIASGFTKSGLSEWIGSQLTVIQGVHLFLMIAAVTLLVLALTEITSNTATATMMLPIMASLAFAIDVHPYALMIASTVAASCAFMLPVATPPNAIVFATGKLEITDMVKAGVWVNLFTIVIIVLAIYFFLPLVWGIDLTTYPEAFMK